MASDNPTFPPTPLTLSQESNKIDINNDWQTIAHPMAAAIATPAPPTLPMTNNPSTASFYAVLLNGLTNFTTLITQPLHAIWTTNMAATFDQLEAQQDQHYNLMAQANTQILANLQQIVIIQPRSGNPTNGLKGLLNHPTATMLSLSTMENYKGSSFQLMALTHTC